MNSIEKALQKQQQDAEDQRKSQVSQPQTTTESMVVESSIDKSQNVQSPKKIQKPNVSTSRVKPAKSDGIVSNSKIEIDLDILEQKGFVSTNSQRQVINEEYRAIKRKLLDNAFGPLSKSLKNSNVIIVTSSRQGEGKTFTAINLALSIALEQDKTVLLVDADVLRPNVMRTLELNNEQGLMEYLLGEKAFSDSIPGFLGSL